MPIYLLAFFLGIVCGLRTFIGPTAVSWAAKLGALSLSGTRVAFLAHPWAPWILSAIALAELVGDQLPKTPSRTIPPAFLARVLSGALSGGAIAIGAGAPIGGAVAGALGAIAGTLGGYRARKRLAATFGSDRRAALVEDAVAIGAAALVVLAVR